MGPDGNVVLDDRGHAMWADGKTGYPNAYLAMQGDDNLVEYSASGVAVWSSGTGVTRVRTRRSAVPVVSIWGAQERSIAPRRCPILRLRVSLPSLLTSSSPGLCWSWDRVATGVPDRETDRANPVIHTRSVRRTASIRSAIIRAPMAVPGMM